MRELVEPGRTEISLQRHCELLGLPISTYYYKAVGIDDEQTEQMKAIDRIYTRFPFYGSRRIAKALQNEGFIIGRKRIRSLMRLMNNEAIHPRPNTSKPCPEHKIFPYLLKDLKIDRPNQVWCTDITYIRLGTGWAYLMAVMDWHSRQIISWGLSNTMDANFCVGVLEDSLKNGKPDIFNTDQGSQYTSSDFVNTLQSNNIQVSMDGRGRYLDNILIERFWRSVKYEHIFLNSYQTLSEAKAGLSYYIKLYNEERLHQSLGYLTPNEVWLSVA